MFTVLKWYISREDNLFLLVCKFQYMIFTNVTLFLGAPEANPTDARAGEAVAKLYESGVSHALFVRVSRMN